MKQLRKEVEWLMGYEASGGKDHKGKWGAVIDRLAKEVAELKKK